MKHNYLFKALFCALFIFSYTTIQSQVSENFDTSFGNSYGNYTDIGTNSDFNLVNGLSETASKARSGRAIRFNKSGSPSLTYAGVTI